MNKGITISAVFCLLLWAGAAYAQENTNTFGEAFSAEQAITYDALLQQMQSSDKVEATVKGKVEAVCQMKGCWMSIVSNEEGRPEMVVKFKDYGFFVPKDIAGRTVIMKGEAYKEVTGVDELKHLAEDAGKSKKEIKKIKKPKEEFKFMATGVVLVEE